VGKTRVEWRNDSHNHQRRWDDEIAYPFPLPARGSWLDN
jgi:hypothetical protein